MEFSRSERYRREHAVFFYSNSMPGPDVLKLIEILAERMNLEPGMRVLDMGCGKGLSSMFLAMEFGLTVFATDRWISPTDNLKRFESMGVADTVFPIKAEAHSLPYANGFFDAAISIDAYHYFGTDETFFPGYYANLVKKGGQFGILSPGLTREFNPSLPDRMRALWEPDMFTVHSEAWWAEHWSKTGLVKDVHAQTVEGGKELWASTADAEFHALDEEGYLTLFCMTPLKA